MGRTLTIGNPPIEVALRQSRRARRMSLRVSRLDGRVSITVPPSAAQSEVLNFLLSKEGWLQRHITDVAPVSIPQIGGSLLFQGEALPIRAATVKRPIIRNAEVLAPANTPDLGRKLAAMLKARAREELMGRSQFHVAKLDRRFAKITLRDTRSRWGSCSSTGALMYSWRLIMAPPDVLDYVVAHEVAHLVEMNHSPRFWALVENLKPDFKDHKAWLRTHGDSLHAVRFD